MKDINPMNAVALFLVVGKLRPGPTWALVGWSFAWFLVMSILQISLQPAPPMPGVDPGPAMAVYMAGTGLMMLIGLVSWAVPFAAWMRLLTTGEGGGAVPFRLGREEMWALIVILALFATFGVATGIVAAVMMVLASFNQAFALLGILVVPAVAIAGAYAGIRLTPAAALSAMTHRFAVSQAWHAMKGKVGAAFVAWIVIVVASAVGMLALTVAGMIVPALSMQQAMIEWAMGGEKPGLVAILPFSVLSLIVNLPVALMGYSTSAYFALAVSGRDDAWTQAIASVEAEADAEAE